MVNSNAVLYVHIFFAFIMFGCLFAALLVRCFVLWRSNPSDIAIILGMVRPVVPALVISLTITFCFGFWIATVEGYNLNENWLIVTYVLIGYIYLVGGLAGGFDRRTREVINTYDNIYIF